MNRLKSVGIVLLSLVLASAMPHSTLARTSLAQDEILTNDHVIDLTRAGLNPALIVGKIRSSRTRFDLSTAELLRLKKASVRDEVLEAMMSAASSVAPSAGVPNESETTRARLGPSSPAERPSERGIFWVRADRLIQLEPAVYSKQKMSGGWKAGLTAGIIKARMKAVVAGKRASLQISEPSPTFLFDLGAKSEGLHPSTYWPGASSANEFILVKMKVERNAREVETGEFGAFGASMGVSEDQVREFDFEKLDSGLYRVRPRRSLESGEYCFFYGGAVGWSKVFDFSVGSAQ